MGTPRSLLLQARGAVGVEALRVRVVVDVSEGHLVRDTQHPSACLRLRAPPPSPERGGSAQSC
eukprot:COSAG01_NODE_3499_length_6004_cov_2.645047_7_plen_63_part_00